MNPDHKSLETVFLIDFVFTPDRRQSKTLLTIDERGSKIARNSVIQISPVANLDMIRGIPTCTQICMCV